MQSQLATLIVKDIGFDKANLNRSQAIAINNMKKVLRRSENSNGNSIHKRILSPEKKAISGKRLIAAGTFVTLGLAALAVGISSISYRLTHLIVDNGLVNGRVVRLRSEIDGEVAALFVRPGMRVNNGDVLVRIDRSYEQEQSLVGLESQIRSKVNQLNSAIQTQSVQEARLRGLESQRQGLWSAERAVSADGVAGSLAALEAARAEARAAKINYQRNRQLHQQGVIARNQVDQLYALWESAEARVKEATANLKTAQRAVQTASNNTAMLQYGSWAKNVIGEIAELQKAVQAQSIIVENLRTEVEIARERLRQARSLYNRERQDLLEIETPISGVVYRTHREQHEHINQSEPLVTILDCQQIWTEVVISAEQANSIDQQKPVSVEILGTQEKLLGQIEIIQPISRTQGTEESGSNFSRVQALSPIISTELDGQPLKRVAVSIEPPSTHDNEQKFCGVGQSATVSFSKKLFTSN